MIDLSDRDNVLMRVDALGQVVARCATLDDALSAVLDAAIALHGADYGNVQLFQGRELVIAAQRGFKRPFLDTFSRVALDDDSACGRAMRHGRPVLIEDVEMDADYAPFRAAAAEAGYRGVQSTPLVSTHGEFMGMLSTHFIRPHSPSKAEMTAIGLYATLAADAVLVFARNRLLGE